jgi:exonuclease III
MQGVVEELQRVNADIACFQEVKTHMLPYLLSQKYVQDNYYVSDISGNTLGSYGVVRIFTTIKNSNNSF